MTLRFGLLGAGRIGKVHARAIRGTAGAELAAVADAVPAAAEAVARDHGCDVRSVEGIEAADDADAVVICIPTDTHAGLIERFARAGKVAAFIEAVRSRGPTPTTGEDGLRALALADAALRSVREGRTVEVAEVVG